MPTASQTRRGTPKLSEVARSLVAPSGIVATGWPSVRETCSKKLGIRFDPWQDGAGRLILAKREGGQLAATIGGVGMSLPRQVGKTHLIGALTFGLCVNTPGLLVIWSAHHARTHGETFIALQSFATRHKVRPWVRQVFTGSGAEEIRFHNGSRILFGARERGFGRGIPGVDMLVFDEAQILTERALDGMLATMNTSTLGLAVYVGTPPRPEDAAESFSRMRADALTGSLEDGVWIEFGADPNADPDDRTQWAKANPSFPRRTPTESILRLRRKLSEDSFMREGLGVWDTVRTAGVIPSGPWGDQEDRTSLATDRFALGVEVGPDLVWASISLAGQRPDGRWHFELEADQHISGRGVAWLGPRVKALVQANPQIRAVVVDVGGPVTALLEEKNGRLYLKDTGVEVTPLKVAELGAACSLVLDGTVTGWLHHIGQPQFTSAALSAGKRALGDTGKWVWSRKTAESDITPIQAGTYALFGAQASAVKKPYRERNGNRRGTIL